MADLIRWDPFREMMRFRDAMDRLFDNTLASTTWEWRAPWVSEPALDVIESADDYVVKASIPGINPDDLEITFTERTLTIKGEVKEEKQHEGVQYHLRERRYGSFSRSITLPTPVNADAIEAKYEAGVLTLRIPKTEEVKPKRIPIKVSEPKMIEGKAKEK